MDNQLDNLTPPEQSADVQDRLRYLIKLSRMTQAEFAQRIGVNSANLSRILTGRMAPTDGFLNRVVVNLGVSKAWLSEGSDVPFPRSSSGKTPARPQAGGAPVYDIDVTAGLTPLSRMFTDERVIGHVRLPGIDPELPIVRVSGNSMSPRLNSGSYISIRPMRLDSTISWGQIYVVVHRDFRVVKYVRRNPDPAKVTLHSENPDYDDIEIDRTDIEGLYLVENVINYDFLA
ncbi:HTH-type transcriptional regulator PrtR [Muribaculaceae bacterium]|nr:HTH-type transcriptional regulator PrtR [Muribaculaceae bacterium]